MHLIFRLFPIGILIKLAKTKVSEKSQTTGKYNKVTKMQTLGPSIWNQLGGGWGRRTKQNRRNGTKKEAYGAVATFGPRHNGPWEQCEEANLFRRIYQKIHAE